MYKHLKSLNPSEEKGYVYILYSSESNLVKIGKTKQPQVKLTKLSLSNGSEFEYTLSPETHLYSILEKCLHSYFNIYRTKGEWFRIDYAVAVDKLNSILESDDFKRRNIK